MLPENNLDFHIRLLKPSLRLVKDSSDTSRLGFNQPLPDIVRDPVAGETRARAVEENEPIRDINDILPELFDDDFRDVLETAETALPGLAQAVEDRSLREHSISLDPDLASSARIPGVSRDLQCPLCGGEFDGRKRRRISELCGHTICLPCSYANDSCPLCNARQVRLVSSSSSASDDGQISSLRDMPIASRPPPKPQARNEEDVIILGSQQGPPRVGRTAGERRKHSPDVQILGSGQAGKAGRQPRWIGNDVRDSGPDYRQTYGHSARTLEAFRRVFGLKVFRTNQLEAINAALLNEDCFILMPTGGGKSLCYQLPAYVQHTDDSGLRGITVVISPLKALIMDQVQKLGCLGIPAVQISSGAGSSPTKDWQRPSLDSSCRDVAIVYITPEKLGCSQVMYRMLDELHSAKRLNRFVIDEVHCVSEWGHDFRPDYKTLGRLRQRYPTVPLMLLTATATGQVRADVLRQMNISTCRLFIQSFNRPNLRYIVLKKDKTAQFQQTVLDLLRKDFRGQSGILYCLSRNDTEKYADWLCQNGIRSMAYHAGQGDKARCKAQNAWSSGECEVICATIAFGMGIDKPDVRFVFHLSIPKSIEGYYQESGRAGRDGQSATCLMFYSYYDMIKLKSLITKPGRGSEFRSPSALSRSIDHIHRVVQYCENTIDCRRRQLLTYFGERSGQCRLQDEQLCDICTQAVPAKLVDVSDVACKMVKCVCELQQAENTLAQYVDIFKGSMNSRTLQLGRDRLEAHGCASRFTRCTIERLLMKLVIGGYLKQDIQTSTYDTAVAYLRPSAKAQQFYTNLPCRPVVMLTVDATTKAQPTHGGSIDLSSDQLGLRRIKLRCLADLKSCLAQIERTSGKDAVRQAFSETCLREMAEQLPSDKAQMLNVTEVTERKFSRYNGQLLLQVTCKYKEQYDELAKQIDSQKETDRSSAAPPTNLLSTLPPSKRRRAFRRRGNKRSKAGPSNKKAKRPKSRFKLMASSK